MRSKTDDVLMIFMKYPEPGKVKTRLAKDIGFEEATKVYKDMAEYVLRSTKCHKYNQKLYFSPETAKNGFLKWLGEKDYMPQTSGDLGERIYNAFKHEFDLGANKVVVIGADCPDCDADSVAFAFERLDKNDAVIGPASDGGYYLLGLKSNNLMLFDDIDWSSDRVFEQTCQRLNLLAYSYEVLDVKHDIDTVDDLKTLKSSSFLDKASKY